MRYPNVRGADLNLLLAAQVLFEERNISRAAERFYLSQPAMSRMLQRLREMFQDELLVRMGSGYGLTPRAAQLQEELAEMLPALDRMIGGGDFDPWTAQVSFRVALTDYAAMVIVPELMREMAAVAPGVALHLQGWGETAFDELEKGKIDVAFWANDVPEPFVKRELFDEDFVCVMDADHPMGARTLTMADYLECRHVVVSVLGGQQTVVEKRLEAMGAVRRIGLRMPYFVGAVVAVRGTDMVATVPRRLAMQYADQPGLRMMDAPAAIGGFRYVMTWHPRMEQDMAHRWLREFITQSTMRLDYSLEGANSMP